MLLQQVFICVLTLFTVVSARQCSEKEAINALSKPIYDFSVRFLDKISHETDGHFVYSPLATWMQLMALAEGARGATLTEIWRATKLRRRNRKLCYRRKLRKNIDDLNKESVLESQRNSLIIVDNLFKVKNQFVTEVEVLEDVKVLSLNFRERERSADKTNSYIQFKSLGAIDEVVSPEDFDMSSLLMIDTLYFRSTWKYPFDPIYTAVKPFHKKGIEIGEVNMMKQIRYLNTTEIPVINAKVLELPTIDDRVSMLVFLPLKDSIYDIFYLIKDIHLVGIFNKFKIEGVKAVEVSLPRFNITTDFDNIRELLYDMGVRKAFYPDRAELNGISDYKIDTSLMTQLVKIEVDERHVTASSSAEFLISDTVLEFNANQAFAYMLVDRVTKVILFAGMYSEPSLH